MTKTGVKRFLALYFLVFFGAVFLRIDYFPLSWVPMYGYRHLTPELTVKFGDMAQRGRGFFAQRADAGKLYVSTEDLNIPPGHFRRAFHQRAFNDPPPQDDRERLELAPFNRWWYDTFVGPDPRLKRMYSQQLLTSVNRTFGYGGADPRRIVRLEALVDFATYTRDQLARGDLTHPSIEPRTAIITEHGSFVRRGNGVVEPMPDGLVPSGAIE
jgi:hypothetical protein